MLIANPRLAAEETYVAFKNLRLLAACGGILGLDNAHFATIAASNIRQRVSNPECVELLDGKSAEQRSACLRAFYNAKRKARSLVKQIVPRQALRFLELMIHRR
jgi:hypothetical protein